MIFNKKLITTKNELLKYKDDIHTLFEECFSSEFNSSLWNWAYINNVCGESVVSLYFFGDKLVGHYAIIPIRLKLNNKIILAGLSMTTMVHINFRRHGIFVQQAKEVYEEAKKLGFLLIYGFPNKNSAPGFKKRLGWMLDSEGGVIQLQGKELLSKDFNLTNKIHFGIEDNEFMEWRLSKPGQEYSKYKSLILKKFEKNVDIVFHNYDFSELERDIYYNLFVDDDSKFQSKKVFDYTFGYKILDDSLVGSEFKKDLIMSDIF